MDPEARIQDATRAFAEGKGIATGIEALQGDASSRAYFRVRVAGLPQASLVAMVLPRDPTTSEERSPDALSTPAELPFINVHRLLQSRAVPVPVLHHYAKSSGVLLLEDLGDTTLERQLLTSPKADWAAHYEPVVRLLATMHTACARKEPHCIAYARHFDADLLRWELDHFREWGIEAVHGPLPARTRRQLDTAFDRLVRALQDIPQGFVHRDFQSRNLMLTNKARLVLLDFQDALWGPAPYDLVALLCDSYLDLPASLQLAMIESYAAHSEGEQGMEQLLGQFWLLAIQRKLKDAGRFVYIDRAKHNPRFLPYYAQSLRYVARALEHSPNMANLRPLLEASVPGFPNEVAQPASAHAL